MIEPRPDLLDPVSIRIASRNQSSHARILNQTRPSLATPQSLAFEAHGLSSGLSQIDHTPSYCAKSDLDRPQRVYPPSSTQRQKQ